MQRDHVSVSSVSTYTSCPRQYYYTYSNAHEPDNESDSQALNVGSLVHDAIELMYRQDVKAAKQHILYGGEYSNASRTEAYEVFEVYAHHILHDIGFTRPLLLEDVFEYTLPGTDLTVTGRIDAVLVDAQGRMTLVDWKVRRYPVDDAVIQLDPQLYVYYHYLANVLELPIERAVQVQILKGRMPKQVTRNATGRPSLRGSTTNHNYEKDMQTLDMDADTHRGMFANQIKPVSYFLPVTDIDLSHTNKMLSRFTFNALNAMTDNAYNPTPGTMTCKFCDFKNTCLTSKT